MSFLRTAKAFLGDPDARREIAEEKLRKRREELGIKNPQTEEEIRKAQFANEAAKQKAREKAYAERVAWEERYTSPTAVNTNSIKRSKALKTLGLNETATKNEIRRKFHSLALRHHPNKGGNTEYFKQLSLAYEFLTQSGGKRTLRRKSRKNNTRRRSKL